MPAGTAPPVRPCLPRDAGASPLSGARSRPSARTPRARDSPSATNLVLPSARNVARHETRGGGRRLRDQSTPTAVARQRAFRTSSRIATARAWLRPCTTTVASTMPSAGEQHTTRPARSDGRWRGPRLAERLRAARADRCWRCRCTSSVTQRAMLSTSRAPLRISTTQSASARAVCPGSGSATGPAGPGSDGSTLSGTARSAGGGGTVSSSG